LFATFVAIDASLIAWLYKNYELHGVIANSITLILVCIFSIGIILIVKSILKNITKLKDL